MCCCIGYHRDGNELPRLVSAGRRPHKILCEVQRHHCVFEINNIDEEGRFYGNEPVCFKDDGGR